MHLSDDQGAPGQAVLEFCYVMLEFRDSLEESDEELVLGVADLRLRCPGGRHVRTSFSGRCQYFRRGLRVWNGRPAFGGGARMIHRVARTLARRTLLFGSENFTRRSGFSQQTARNLIKRHACAAASINRFSGLLSGLQPSNFFATRSYTNVHSAPAHGPFCYI